MAPMLSRQPIFGVFSWVSYLFSLLLFSSYPSLLGIEKRKKKQITGLTRKPRKQVRILIYRTLRSASLAHLVIWSHGIHFLSGKSLKFIRKY